VFFSIFRHTILMKKTLLFLIFFIAFNKGFAACDNVCEGPGNSCSPGTGNNSGCCRQTVGEGSNQVAANAIGCYDFCAAPSNRNYPECRAYIAAPINKGLIILIGMGFVVGTITFYRIEKKKKQRLA
jgi:hypothetical protein